MGIINRVNVESQSDAITLLQKSFLPPERSLNKFCVDIFDSIKFTVNTQLHSQLTQLSALEHEVDINRYWIKWYKE